MGVAGVPSQVSVDSLQKRLGLPNLTVRTAVLKALNRLRERAPELDCGEEAVTRQIHREAQSYFELYAALTRFRERQRAGKATALLTRTVEERLKQIIDRLFRLLGLRYPPKQIYAAYLAVSHRRSEEFATALEFLDTASDIIMPLCSEKCKHWFEPRFLHTFPARREDPQVRNSLEPREANHPSDQCFQGDGRAVGHSSWRGLAVLRACLLLSRQRAHGVPAGVLSRRPLRALC